MVVVQTLVVYGYLMSRELAHHSKLFGKPVNPIARMSQRPDVQNQSLKTRYKDYPWILIGSIRSTLMVQSHGEIRVWVMGSIR